MLHATHATPHMPNAIRFHSTTLRKMSMDWIYEVMKKEDEFTHNICIGPVNKMINMLVCFIQEGKGSAAFKAHLERIPDYMWMGRDGMKMNGTNINSQHTPRRFLL